MARVSFLENFTKRKTFIHFRRTNIGNFGRRIIEKKTKGE